MTSCENQQLIQSVFYLSSPFYVRGGPLEITGEARSGTEKKHHEAARKKSCRQVSWKKKIRALKKFHPPSGYFYFPLLNYHVAVMTEVFSLGANQESERLRPFGTGSVEQCALLYSFLGSHFLSPVYSFPTFIGPPRMDFNRRRRIGSSFRSLTVPNFPKVEEAPSVGGYDDEFVNAVEDDLQCSICHLPLKNPMQTKCGHRCCKTCLDEHFKRFAFLINAKWLLFISLCSVYVCEQIHSFSNYVWFWVEFLSCLYCLSIPIHFKWLWYMKGLSSFFKFATESGLVQRFCRITKHL